MKLKSTEVRKYDEKFMRQCIELSQESVNLGDAAFGSLIAIDDKLIAEGLNDYKTKISEHAEIVALNKAHKILGTSDLSACTLYTSCEPCPMCSFMIREFKIKRVVFALSSLYVGGYSKWPILQDTEISELKPIFSNPPEVLAGFMEAEAKIVMEKTSLWMFGNDAKSRNPDKKNKRLDIIIPFSRNTEVKVLKKGAHSFKINERVMLLHKISLFSWVAENLNTGEKGVLREGEASVITNRKSRKT